MTDHIKLGRYQHYKGNFYEVLGEAYHHETLEKQVVYKALYNHPEVGNEAWFIRPKEEFLQTVEYNGATVPRFRYID